MNLRGYNFWSDYTGYVGILENLPKYFLVIQENFFGSFRFIFSGTFFILLQWLIFKTVSPVYGTFLVIFLINFLNLLLGYKLCKIFLKNKLHSFAFSLLYIYNPVYLYALYVNLTLGFLLSIAGFTLFYYMYTLSNNNRFAIVWLLPLTSILISHPFFFVFYILQSTFLIMRSKKYLFLVYFLLGSILVNIYWIIPFVLGFLQKTSIPNILGQAEFSKDILENYAGYLHSFTFAIRSFEFHKSIYGLFYPLTLIIWPYFIYTFLKNKKKDFLLLIPLLIYITFSLGGKGYFGAIFNYMWSHFSFLHFFRSFTNIGYISWYYLLYLILKSYEGIKNKTIHHRLTLILCVFFVVTPLLYNNYASYGKTTHLPAEYFKLQEYINKQSDDFYIFRLPYSMYEYYSWDNSHRDKYFFEDFFNKGVVYNAIGMYTYDNKNNLIGMLYRSIYSGADIDNLLGRYGVKYILVSKDLTQINERYFLNISSLNLKKLDKVISNQYFDLYKLHSYKGKIISPNIKVNKVDSTRYNLEFTDLPNKTDIIFNTAYDKNWKLYLQNGDEKVNREIDNSHQIYNSFGNKWSIDPKNISLDPSKKKPLKLILFYTKQDVFFSALHISAFSLALILIIFMVVYARSYKK